MAAWRPSWELAQQLEYQLATAHVTASEAEVVATGAVANTAAGLPASVAAGVTESLALVWKKAWEPVGQLICNGYSN